MTMTHARYGALVHQRIVLFFWYSQIERLTQQVLVLSSTVAAPFSRCPFSLSAHTVLSVLADNAARTDISVHSPLSARPNPPVLSSFLARSYWVVLTAGMTHVLADKATRTYISVHSARVARISVTVHAKATAGKRVLLYPAAQSLIECSELLITLFC